MRDVAGSRSCAMISNHADSVASVSVWGGGGLLAGCAACDEAGTVRMFRPAGDAQEGESAASWGLVAECALGSRLALNAVTEEAALVLCGSEPSPLLREWPLASLPVTSAALPKQPPASINDPLDLPTAVPEPRAAPPPRPSPPLPSDIGARLAAAAAAYEDSVASKVAATMADVGREAFEQLPSQAEDVEETVEIQEVEALESDFLTKWADEATGDESSVGGAKTGGKSVRKAPSGALGVAGFNSTARAERAAAAVAAEAFDAAKVPVSEAARAEAAKEANHVDSDRRYGGLESLNDSALTVERASKFTPKKQVDRKWASKLATCGMGERDLWLPDDLHAHGAPLCLELQTTKACECAFAGSTLDASLAEFDLGISPVGAW